MEPSLPCLYAMKQSADGHGLFATEDIKAGTRIIQELPIIAISRDEVQQRGEHTWVISKTSELPAESRRQLMSLYHNPKKLQDFAFLNGQSIPSTDLDSALVLAKFYTNAASISTGGLQVGLFATFCRMNHSCTPNTCWVYDAATQMMEVYTVRPIAAGEEITDSYTDVARPRASRAKELANWGFCCACATCEGPNAQEHETRRRRIAQVRGILDIYQDRLEDGEKPAFAEMPKTDLEALKLAEESVDLLSREGLVEDLGVAYGWCAKFARTAGLHDVADLNEEKEYEILVLTTGEYE